ncbi:C-type lysozyme, inhibitor [Halomonas sp. 707D4]|uniref:C-type lysozyme, inhibitor n=2 Tax=unclassified Halomonas TaxID=2609666 RepID=UPI0020A1FA7A|nr:C-type lysozyme, inhibitor [Halomonas sp. 707D4]MCP1325889.1 C-type lysozyme, inhibitor [Halomonas sp. 707D4]
MLDATLLTSALSKATFLKGVGALCLGAGLAGCASAPTPPPMTPVAGNAAPLLPSALFPGSAERFQAWHCQPANQHLVGADNDQALRLWSLHGAWQLPRAVVADGARYQDGEISVWDRGERALVETPRGQLQCQQAGERKALTRADNPGVMFKAEGREPSWQVTLAHDVPTLAIETATAPATRQPYMISVLDNQAGRVVLESADVEPFFRLRIDAGACFDKASGAPYPARVTLTYQGEQYSGCGQGIAP